MKSTSIHRLNIDIKRHKVRKILWRVFNFANTNFFPNYARDLNIQHFMPHLTETDWEKINEKSSPSRALSDLFWLKLDWESIQKTLGEIHIFDVGCGSGNYALKLQEFSKHRIASYCGVDCRPRENWATLQEMSRFITLRELNSNNIYPAIPATTNLFISQSAIEHFEEDLVYFQQVKKYITRTQKEVIQAHLLPSKIHLKLFPLHGVRQYFPRTIAKITRLFDGENSYSILFNLGGRHCNALHYEFITQPLFLKSKKEKVDRRETETERYRMLLREAIAQDIQAKKTNDPHCYALIIHSNYTTRLFH